MAHLKTAWAWPIGPSKAAWRVPAWKAAAIKAAHSLHIRCSDRIWTGDNSCQVSLANTSLKAGETATLRFKARWLHGWPEALLRLNGNWLEAAGAMPVPSNLGTPGMPNSQYVTNAGPAIYKVIHSPTVPAANQPVGGNGAGA